MSAILNHFPLIHFCKIHFDYWKRLWLKENSLRKRLLPGNLNNSAESASVKKRATVFLLLSFFLLFKSNPFVNTNINFVQNIFAVNVYQFEKSSIALWICFDLFLCEKRTKTIKAKRINKTVELKTIKIRWNDLFIVSYLNNSNAINVENRINFIIISINFRFGWHSVSFSSYRLVSSSSLPSASIPCVCINGTKYACYLHRGISNQKNNANNAVAKRMFIFFVSIFRRTEKKCDYKRSVAQSKIAHCAEVENVHEDAV